MPLTNPMQLRAAQGLADNSSTSCRMSSRFLAHKRKASYHICMKLAFSIATPFKLALRLGAKSCGMLCQQCNWACMHSKYGILPAVYTCTHPSHHADICVGPSFSFITCCSLRTAYAVVYCTFGEKGAGAAPLGS